jgi:hypothetical protein
MAKRHKHAGASVAIATKLEPIAIAELCENAARKAESIQAQVRLEESKQGRLVYSVRNRLVGGHIEFLTFAVTLVDGDGRRHIKTQILSYKQKRDWVLIIPMPWRMLGWSTYKSFMHGLGAAVRSADGTASATIVEVAGRA